MKQIYQTLAKTFQTNVEDINDESSPLNVENWTSMTHILALTDIETAFNFKFTQQEILSIETVSDIRRIVEAKQAN